MDDRSRIITIENGNGFRIKHCHGINSSTYFHVIGSHTPSTAISVIRRSEPDAILIGLDFSTKNDISLIRMITNKFPNLRIMLVSESTNEQHIISAFEAGACSYILKDSDDEHIIDAIEQLVAGGAPISPSVAIYLLKRFHKNTEKPPLKLASSLLTVREKETLQLMAKGFTYTEISNVLGVSINTTRVHTKNIYHKLSVHSRGEAVYEALEKGILSLQ